MNYNKVVLVGRLTRDPESRQTVNGTLISTFTLAVNRSNRNDDVDFIRIVTFNRLAEFVQNYLTKGRLVLVEGKLRINRWQTNDGQNRSTPEIWADQVTFMDRKSDNSLTDSSNETVVSYDELFDDNESDEPPF
ncbi:single-stranded DNA-binding protein [Thermosipho melanesiensis]|uniref:Single-stranded DNA-binding protein n=2 Tax=Thermosipho melanesiensis TaxID=46541 RepID=A6LKQ0_THEM4|nr:single-stranded DNA-binding protein [Thermosipho melanesiensis]ABR30501.1 single-strand binding protein [Thermosipho melanesiensis BI429]APT73652.1 single-stranded DNA-binding protein [Thermosipho melanesiensis]OOC35594.1 single-stranded DNA-binding protein [Thermosipho melanesiensis]OOC39268.1 single-stranded DNA-binding protein [Thermosipho melanesiensis]OOC39354.1 single-stranded DNA-binding protein [Thermosipho melanesiensis]